MGAFNPQSEIRNPQWPYALCCALTASLIVASAAAGGEARHGDAVNVFHCTFDEKWDVNYDGWPDRWVRKSSADYPHYVNIQIQDDETAPDKKCLRIDLDGAAAAVVSPPIRVLPRFSYDFEAQLKTERLQHSTVVLTLDFYDKTGRVLQTKRSKPVSITKGWESVQLAAIEPADSAIDRVVLGLKVVRGNKGDLQGRVSLADVRLARLPRIAVSTNNPSNVYTELNGVVIQCELSGIPERDPEIRFQLLDASNKELQTDHFRLDGRLIVDDLNSASGVTDGSHQGPDGFEGTKEWRPNIPDYGYYRVVVRMFSSEPADGRDETDCELGSPRTIYLAVVPPLPMPRRGEFAWTLPNGDQPLSFQELSRLLPQVGINWVKVPVWFDAANQRRGDELIRFVELLGASNIDVVGIIDVPPTGSDLAGRVRRGIPIAELLSADTSAWSASLEPVMTRLSLRVRWWQLGRDGDLSFAGFPALGKHIEKLRTALFRFGQDVRLGMSWDWASTANGNGPVTWDFQQQCLEVPPTEQEFNELLAKPRGNRALRWITIEPPPSESVTQSESDLLARSSELVRRMVAAKVHGADAIVVSNPFNDGNGLMRASGMPAELLLPWRTTAVMLGGAAYLGEMRLPAGSTNRVFLRPDGQVVMVVWNSAPTEEVLYLGEDVKLFDVFGRSTQPAQQGREQVIRVDATPAFILGLNEAITRWRMAVSFEKHQVPSIMAKPHANSLRFRNFFPQGVGGTVKIVVLQERRAEEHSFDDKATAESPAFTLDRWTIEPPQAQFQLAADEEMQFPFAVVLRNALFGKQPVRVDFKIEAEEELYFSVYQDMEVGTKDLTLQVNTHLEKDDTLIIEQLMTNGDGRLADFKCYLLAKGHRPQRMQVYRLGTNVDRKVYRFPDAAQLVGKEMLLEIEELNGQRALKYRFVARDTPREPETGQETVENSGAAEVTATPTKDAHVEESQS